MRTHLCGLVDQALVGQTVTLWQTLPINLATWLFIRVACASFHPFGRQGGIIDTSGQGGLAQAGAQAAVGQWVAAQIITARFDELFRPAKNGQHAPGILGGEEHAVFDGHRFLGQIAMHAPQAARVGNVVSDQEVCGHVQDCSGRASPVARSSSQRAWKSSSFGSSGAVSIMPTMSRA